MVFWLTVEPLEFHGTIIYEGEVTSLKSTGPQFHIAIVPCPFDL